MPDIAILLATYNNEPYLPEQLDSLFAQTHQDWTLYVRDDGSTDHTPDILKAYQDRYGADRMVVTSDGKGNLGARGNFMRLLDVAEADYYFFCDGDDVWLPQKVENSLAKMHAIDTDADLPAMVFTNLRLVDGQLRELSPSFWQSIHFSPDVFNDFRSMAFIGYVTGCTLLFNRRAKELALPIAPYAPMHDWWVAVCTYQNGGRVGWVSEPQMLYRKHGGNATGDFVGTQKGKGLCRRWCELMAQYRLMKACGAATSFPQYLYHKYQINQKRKRC